MFPRSDYEPDVVFFGTEKAARLDGDTMKFPVPDFVAEVLSDSTMGRDRGVKFEDFAANGVREYWIVDPEIRTIEQYVLPPESNTYNLRPKVNSGEVWSVAVEGFVIPVEALFDEVAAFEALKSLLG